MKKRGLILAFIILSNNIMCDISFAKEAQQKSYDLSNNILTVAGKSDIENSFFGVAFRTKYIERWGILKNSEKETLNDHLLDTARIAHMLVLIKNEICDKNELDNKGKLDSNRVVVLAMYHDLTEIFTDDMPTPVKYGQQGMKDLYNKMDEKVADEFLLRLPKEFRDSFSSILKRKEEDAELWKIVKNADKLSAFIKCLSEKNLGNKDFNKAYDEIEKTLLENDDPAVKYFMEKFLPAFGYEMKSIPSKKPNNSTNELKSA